MGLGRRKLPTEQQQILCRGLMLVLALCPGVAAKSGMIVRSKALPIMTEDKVQIGAIGISGGTADQDETCAEAGRRR